MTKTYSDFERKYSNEYEAANSSRLSLRLAPEEKAAIIVRSKYDGFSHFKKLFRAFIYDYLNHEPNIMNWIHEYQKENIQRRGERAIKKAKSELAKGRMLMEQLFEKDDDMYDLMKDYLPKGPILYDTDKD